MKKILFLLALCAVTAAVRATNYNYLCAITELTVDTLASNSKNQYILSWTQVCKNTAEYSTKPSGTYTTTVKLYLNSDDRTLDGVYTTEGAHPSSTSANVNDQTIGVVLSELYYGNTRRVLRTDSVSTFVINKEPDGRYSIGECTLYFTAAAMQDRGKNTYAYNYCYAEEEILNEGIDPTPYIFSFGGASGPEVYDYDMTVNGISVVRDDNEYGTVRYFLTMNCTGKNRANNSERNYEVQLAIYPSSESIVGSFSTQGSGSLLYASNSYVKDLKINKTRYLANDSLSTIDILSKGETLYSFFGGTMTCVDIDANYMAVYGQKRIEAVHYYHFSDNDGEGIPFNWDEDDKEVELSPYKVSVEPFTTGGEMDHFNLIVHAKDEKNIDYEVSLSIVSNQLDGSFSTANEQLSLWSSVSYGSNYSYLTDGSIVHISAQEDNIHTLSGSLLCENGYSYILNAFDFEYKGETDDSSAAFTVTASKVTIEDMTIDKNNFFVVVEGATSSGSYELAFDVWPTTHSAIGSFNASNGTISYINSYVHKTRANGNEVDMWYSCEYTSAISLRIVSNGDNTCTFSGSIQATRNEVSYTYNIPDFTFAYSEVPVPPDPEQDPFRFEPAAATSFDFTADVIHFRERSDYIEVSLNEMANESYDWIELRLLSNTLAMPAGVYTIDDSNDEGSLTASKGYLGQTYGDDPCFVAIRADKENWGQYTPYYLESGNLTVSYNGKGDTIFIAGTVISHNGSTIHVDARSYNMLYVPDEEPPTPEDVTLAIDTVMITYLSNLSDSANHQFLYTFNFSHSDDYPTVLVDVTLSKPMELVAGIYTLEEGQISGLQLAQNQADFEANLFIGSAYDFVSARLDLNTEEGVWRYEMEMHDAIGSTYRFSLLQAPHIIYYPQPEVPEEDKPFAAESTVTDIYTFLPDTMVWKDETVSQDGIIDIILTCKQGDAEGMRPYIRLGMYSDVVHPSTGIYPVNDSEASGSFSASLGKFGTVLIPCYAAIVDSDGAVRQIWYLVTGDISLSYDQNGNPNLQGECTSYFGSTIQFRYFSQPQGLEELTTDPSKKGTKFIQDGKIYIRHGEHVYDLMGTVKE